MLLLAKRSLQRMGIVRLPQTFQRHYLLAHHRPHGRAARGDRMLIDQYMAGAALRQATTKTGGLLMACVSENV